MGRKVSLDLFLPCLAGLVGQDYARLKRHCDWAKPMTYRLAQGPAGLRLEIPALIEGVASCFGLYEERIVEWSARHAAFDSDMLLETRQSGGSDFFHSGRDRCGSSGAGAGPRLFRAGARPPAWCYRRPSGARRRHGESRPRGERGRARDLMGSDARSRSTAFVRSPRGATVVKLEASHGSE